MNPGNITPYVAPYEASTFLADKTITYDPSKRNGSVQVGLPVKQISLNTVSLASDSDIVIGTIIRVESDNNVIVRLADGVTIDMLEQGAKLSPSPI